MARGKREEGKRPKTGSVEKFREKWVWHKKLGGIEIGRSERDPDRYFIKSGEGNQKVINKEGMKQFIIGFARKRNLEINEWAESLDDLVSEVEKKLS